MGQALSPATLDLCIGCGEELAQLWAPALSDCMVQGGILTPLRQAAFLAQIAHECGNFSEIEENLNYSADGLVRTWPAHFTEDTAKLYAGQPIKLANYIYGPSTSIGKELGNTGPNDGWSFRGRGCLQITGRDLYTQFKASPWSQKFDVVGSPDLVSASRTLSAATAGWEWTQKQLNRLADIQDFREITRRINGGTEGLPHRIELYVRCRGALGLDPWPYLNPPQPISA